MCEQPASPKSAPLLMTRFFSPPLPETCISRPRLISLLDKIYQCPLALLCAPPGFGKSILLSEWIRRQTGLKAGWLSLETTDNDWGVFFRYLAAAWQRVFPGAGQDALAELNSSPSPDKQGLANLLLNDLLTAMDAGGPKHALLVLDDYHRIESPDIHETLGYLLEHLPQGCHLALLTRSDPPLPIARWRSRGWVLEVRADDLRFTTPEATEYLNRSMRLSLTGEQIAVLEERTEGWIAGLQMAALAVQGLTVPGREDAEDAGDFINGFVREFGGSNRFVVDYLVEEVVRQQPEEIQRFLMATAPLEQFCGPLCDELLEASPPYSQRLLERLEKANLFLIALDDHRGWFRYHHLFADLLRVRAQQLDAGRVMAVYRRAALWLGQNGFWREAIRYGLLTRDLELAADLLERAILDGGLDFLFSGLKPLVEPFPMDLVRSRPLVSLAKATAMFDSSQLDGIVPLLRFAEEGLQASPPFEGREVALGWVSVAQSNVATLLGDGDWIIEAARRVPERLPDDLAANIEALLQIGNAFYYEGKLKEVETYWRKALDLSLANSHTYYILCIHDCLPRIYCHMGELNRAESLFQQGFRKLDDLCCNFHSGHYQRWLGAIQRDYADLLRERNRLDEARQMLSDAMPICEKWDTVSGHGLSLIYMARILHASGDLTGAHEMLDRVDELRRTHTFYPDLETLAAFTRARLYLDCGEVERAGQLLDACLHSPCCKHELHREWVITAQARVLLRQQRPAEALALIAGRMEDAKENGRGRNWLGMCLLTALALAAYGDGQNAGRALTEGLDYAQAQGFRRIFVDEGEPMRALLGEYLAEQPPPVLAEYTSEILALFPGQPTTEANLKGALKIEGLYESLSRREEEILRLVCQGLSNQEIAGQLVLSVGTVKFHVHNILGKLGVRDRPKVIAKARALGLGG